MEKHEVAFRFGQENYQGQRATTKISASSISLHGFRIFKAISVQWLSLRCKVRSYSLIISCCQNSGILRRLLGCNCWVGSEYALKIFSEALRSWSSGSSQLSDVDTLNLDRNVVPACLLSLRHSPVLYSLLYFCLFVCFCLEVILHSLSF